LLWRLRHRMINPKSHTALLSLNASASLPLRAANKRSL
jgi:hypothetical protein